MIEEPVLSEGRRSIKTWLFRPFGFFAGGPTPVIGLLVIIVSGLISSMSNTHLDGVLDVHSDAEATLWSPVAEGLLNWFVVFSILTATGKVAEIPGSGFSTWQAPRRSPSGPF